MVLNKNGDLPVFINVDQAKRSTTDTSPCKNQRCKIVVENGKWNVMGSGLITFNFQLSTFNFFVEGTYTVKNRIYRYDNAKCILIFLVLIGHLLECFSGRFTTNIYRTIYLFHMPAFLFLSGYFSSFNRKKILFRLILPYVVLQTLYLIFDAAVLKNSPEIILCYTTPYWILWYLFALIVYNLLIPFFDTDRLSGQAVFLAASVLLSLLAGYDDSIGYFLSLSRILTFAPFFLGGFYFRKEGALFARTNSRFRIIVPIAGVIISLIGIVLAWKMNLTGSVLYGSLSYANAEYSPARKLFLLIIGFGGILCMALIPNQKIPFVSEIGKNTFPIFCLHGFVVRYLDEINFFAHGELVNLAVAGILAVGMMAAFGNRIVSDLFHAVFSEKLLEKMLTGTTKSVKR